MRRNNNQLHNFRIARDPGAIFDIEELITGEPGRAKA
jgi:hypothetical protein